MSDVSAQIVHATWSISLSTTPDPTEIHCFPQCQSILIIEAQHSPAQQYSRSLIPAGTTRPQFSDPLLNHNDPELEHPSLISYMFHIRWSMRTVKTIFHIAPYFYIPGFP